MGEKDISQRIIEKHNEVFADIINVLIYNGKEVIKPENLEQAEQHEVFKKDEKLHELIRDVAKFYRNKEYRIAFYGIENQMKIDKFMPIRIMAYDALTYISQLLQIKEERHKARQEIQKDGENKKRHRRTIYPVKTIVLYFGTEEWKTPLSLKDCIKNFDGSDYKITVIQLSKLPQEVVNKFKSDFYIIADFMANHEKEDYEFPQWEIVHKRDVINVLKALTGDNTIDVLYNECEEGGEKVKDDFFKRYTERKIKQGIERGRQSEAIDIAKRMLEAGALSFEDISVYASLPLEKVKELAEEVCVTAGK